MKFKCAANNLVTLFLSFVLLLAFTACSRSSESEKDKTSKNDNQTELAKKAVESQEQTGSVTFGSSLPLSGPVASYGQRARNGMELARKEWNEEHTPKIKIVYEDNQGQTAIAVSTAQKLISLEKVPVIIGSAASSTTMAMTTVANERKVVLISPIASSPELTTKGGEYFFRLAPSDTAQAKVMADWFKEQNIRKIAVLYFANTWGQSLFEATKMHMAEFGGEVVATEAIQEGQMDFRTEIAKFKESQAQAFYVITHGKEGGAFVKQARQLNVKVPMYGGDVWSSPEFLDVGGPATEGCYYVAPAKPSGPRFDAFATAYKEAYGEDPEVYAAYSFDTVTILANAVESGATSGMAIKDWLLSMPPHEGVSGTIRFDKNGDVVGQKFDRYVIENGQRKIVK